jgi:hypothetical protein
MKSSVQERQPSGKNGAAQGGGNSPKERRRGDKEIATEGMRARALLIWVRNNAPQET